MHHLRLTPWRALGLTVLYFVLWQAAVFLAPYWSGHDLTGAATQLGLSGLFVIGLMWVVWFLERAAQRIELRRLSRDSASLDPTVSLPSFVKEPERDVRSLNPLDLTAWYYGRRSQRLKQSMVVLSLYSLGFFVAHLVLTWPIGSDDNANKVQPYELPAGGGQDMMPRAVQIKKVITPKFVINPYSSIIVNAPPIDHINPQILEVTKGLYVVGQGGGEGTGGGIGQGTGSGSGFGAGTGSGKVRFIRLKHSDRLWDKNFGIGGDLNMLAEYGARTRQKISDKTEYVEVTQLAAFPPRRNPPLLYVGGGKTFLLSQAEKKILQQYLTEKHGMILGDNLGGRDFHNQFVAMMREITGVQEVPIPRDDYIHRRPYLLPSLPIVVAHGGTVPMGWNVDGRWVVYYHPGALSDAWRDDHAGIKREIFEECYQLGVNIIFYAHLEYNKWLQSQTAP